MRMAYFAPILSLLHLFFGGRKEASRKLSFEWKILIWIGHYSSFRLFFADDSRDPVKLIKIDVTNSHEKAFMFQQLIVRPTKNQD